MSVEAWIRDTDGDPPCGPDLEYDPEFLALANAIAGKPEQQYGDQIFPAKDADWENVLGLCETVFRRTKDLRASLILTRALTNRHGLPGLVEGLAVTRYLLEKHWENVHPWLDIDGEADPIIRVNALAGLADASGLLHDIRNSTMLTTPLGPVTVRAAESVIMREPGGTIGLTEAELKQAAAAGLQAGQPSIQAVLPALEHSNAIQALVNERLGFQDAPDLALLTGLLQTVARLNPETAAAGDAPQPNAVVASAGEPAPLGVGGELRNRQDAVRLLDSVCEFLTRSEPSSPAPLFIRRAQRLIGSDFMDIMRDMAPDSLGQIEVIAGLANATPSKPGGEKAS